MGFNPETGVTVTRALRLIVILIAALAGGAFSAAAALSAWTTLMQPAFGPWRQEPDFGGPSPNAYVFALQHMSFRLLSGAEEAVIFKAAADDAGEGLDGTCTYVLRGKAPLARLFTLRAENLDGTALTPAAPLPSVLHSDLMLFEGGGFVVAASAAAQPGNWLAVPREGAYRLVMTAYDASLAGGLAASGFTPPSITKQECAS